MSEVLDTILSIYLVEKSEGNRIEASKLRTSLIRKIYFEDLDREEEPVLPTLIQDELAEIEFRATKYNNSDFAEFFERDPLADIEFSKMTKFIANRLIKEGLLNKEIFGVEFEDQERYVYKAKVWQQYILYYYFWKMLGFESYHERSTSLKHISIKIEGFNGIREAFENENKPALTVTEEKFEALCNSFLSNREECAISEEILVNALLSMFINFIYYGEKEDADYYLIKAKSIITPSNRIYWFVRFLEKEHLIDIKPYPNEEIKEWL